MTQYWTIVSRSSPMTLLYPCFASASSGQHPKDAGLPGWDATTMQAVQIAAPPDPARHAWIGTAWSDDLGKVQAMAIQRVKGEAEIRKMARSTPGGMKKAEYAEKRAEVVQWESLGGTLAAIVLAFDALPAGRKAIRFAHILADAAAFGDRPQDAVQRIRDGMMRAASVPSISAVEARTCAAIRAATTPAAAWAAAASPAWPA